MEMTLVGMILPFDFCRNPAEESESTAERSISPYTSLRAGEGRGEDRGEVI